jgi:hypothetical protein
MPLPQLVQDQGLPEVRVVRKRVERAAGAGEPGFCRCGCGGGSIDSMSGNYNHSKLNRSTQGSHKIHKVTNHTHNPIPNPIIPHKARTVSSRTDHTRLTTG